MCACSYLPIEQNRQKTAQNKEFLQFSNFPFSRIKIHIPILNLPSTSFFVVYILDRTLRGWRGGGDETTVHRVHDMYKSPFFSKSKCHLRFTVLSLWFSTAFMD